LSDDGGMEIDALSGEPGVKSRRWRGYEMSDQEMIDYTLERLKGVPREKRTCRLKVVLCCIMPGQDPIFSDGSIEGIIMEKQETPIIIGFPFRSIMLIPQFNKMYSDLTEAEHHALNQRLIALNKLRVQLGI
ncbi:MAG: non-canonical purine NTP pyrophosphatase, partial [Patescibacteria group bacterium]